MSIPWVEVVKLTQQNNHMENLYLAEDNRYRELVKYETPTDLICFMQMFLIQ